MSLISSSHNERVKLVRLLQRQAKTRRKQQRLVLEGVRLMGDVLDTGVRPDFVCYVADAVVQGGPACDLIARLQADGIACLQVTGALMRDMADTETPQGVLGVFPWPDLPAPESRAWARSIVCRSGRWAGPIW
jgi:TrmH family RNA methyltransferase